MTARQTASSGSSPRRWQPVRYIQDPGLRTLRQDALNEVLVFVGLHLRDDGSGQNLAAILIGSCS
jgi:hypothetical protein